MKLFCVINILIITPSLPLTLPQSHKEWCDVAPFEIDFAPITNEEIRFAYLPAKEGSERAAIMIGGVPRDRMRQKKLPLINKLYGSIALLAQQNKINSLMYQQIGTGESTGDLDSETLKTRTSHLVELVAHLKQTRNIGHVSLIGMSLGSYLAARGEQQIRELGVVVDHLVLQSPAAYPTQVERIPYGAEFTRLIS